MLGGHKTADGFALGDWVSTQRQARESLSADRKQRLEALGFVWDVGEAQWESGFSALQEYKHAKGDCSVPSSHKTADGFQLGRWVGTQRSAKDTMSTDKKQRLDALGFVWDPLSAQWESGFSALQEYKHAKGDCSVPSSHKTADGFKLGNWVTVQRTAKSRNALSADKKQRLEAIDFVWDPLSAQWEAGFSALKAYKQAKGDCLVTATHKTADGFRLGTWARTQLMNRDSMSSHRKQRLDAIGFVWDRKGKRNRTADT